MCRVKVCLNVCLCLLNILTLFVFAAPAAAELESYDFPKGNPVKFVRITMPKVEEIPPASRANEARRQSIASLLSRYNKNLGSEAYDYANLIIETSGKFGQDPFVIAAMVVLESSARNDAVSRGGDYGLMQVRWRVHQKKIRSKYPHIETAKDMFNPKDNLIVGTEIFSGYHAAAEQDVRGALMSYTSGNRRMTDKVFSLVAQLEKSYQKRLRGL